MVEVVLFFLVFLLAYSNGANDISKGIATLVGSGTAGMRRAVVWGVVTTALGSIAAVAVGTLLLEVFSNGVLTDGADAGAIAIAVACAAAVWVLVSSRVGLPVSTTHALVGGIVGAGMAEFGAGGISWSALQTKALVPLLFSPFFSFGLAYLLFPLMNKKMARSRDFCICVQERETAVIASNALTMSIPTLRVVGDDATACEMESQGVLTMRMTDLLHFVSSGLTSFARGLNDTPKIAALLVGTYALTLRFEGFSFLFVGAGILLGGVFAGRRVIDTLSKRITDMDPIEGFTSNAITATLVTAGSFFGLPFSTTHVSTGSIIGIGVSSQGTVRWAIVRDILFAWVVTLPAAAIVAFTIQKFLL